MGGVTRRHIVTSPPRKNQGLYTWLKPRYATTFNREFWFLKFSLLRKWNTLQRTATHCNTLQYTSKKLQHIGKNHSIVDCVFRNFLFFANGTHCNAMQRTAAHCNALQCSATHCNALPWHLIVDYDFRIFFSSPMRHPAAHCSALQHTATHCNTLQHTATHYNTLQHNAKNQWLFPHKPGYATNFFHSQYDFRNIFDFSNGARAPGTHCNTLQHTATRCNTQQHTAYTTPCNTRQHIASRERDCL